MSRQWLPILPQPESLSRVPEAETVLFAVGFDRSGDGSIYDVYVNGLANLLAALPVLPQRFIYISSTGVYGENGGEAVDEDTTCRPARAGGKAHLAAEELLANSRVAEAAVILRCAGLYGPGRIPRLRDLEEQTPIPANPDAYLNLIHIEDAAEVVCRVAKVKPPSQLYVASDGAPVPRREFYQHLADSKNLPPPTFAPPAAASDERRARSDNKRISNARLLREVQPRLRYPSYREGLDAIET